MWSMFKSELSDAWWSLRSACLTALAAAFGKRSHGGKVVTFMGWNWYPENARKK